MSKVRLWIFVFCVCSSILFPQSLRVGIYENDPLSFIDSEGMPRGIFPEILGEIARKEGWVLDFYPCIFGDCLVFLQGQSLDILGAVAFSYERSEIMDFSNETVISNWGVVFSRNDLEVQSFFDLEDRVVAVVIGDTYARELRSLADQFGISITFTDVRGDYLEVMEFVAAGQADVGVVSHIFASKHRYDFPLRLSTLAFRPVELRFAFPKSGLMNEQLISAVDDHLRAFKHDRDSEYHRVISHYLLAPAADREVIPQWLIQLVIIAGIVMAMILFGLWLLRIQVKRKTRALRGALSRIETQKNHLAELNDQLRQANDALSTSNEELSATNETLEETYRQLDEMAEALEYMIQISSRLTVMEVEENKFFLDLLQTAIRLIPQGKYGAIALMDGENWLFEAAVGHDISKLKKIRLPLHTFPQDTEVIVTPKQAKQGWQVSKDLLRQFNEATLPAGETLRATLQFREDVFGVIFIDTPADSGLHFSEESIRIMRAFSNLAATFIASRRYLKMQSRFQTEIITSWIRFLEAHDPYTKGHSEKVASLSAMIATEIGFTQEQVAQIYWAGLVHDVGKILIASEILNKPACLSAEEYEKIKLHPTYGFEILNQSEGLKEIAHIVHFHHERVDGKGYPMGLTGDQNPISSKIIAVADAYDAMTSDRAYRTGMDRKTVLAEMSRGSDAQFDSKILSIFFRLIG